MFEAAEVGRRVGKQDFRRLEPELSTRLLAAQREVQSARIPVIVIVSGVEGAGKGEVVNRLHQWLDSRGMRSAAFWDESDEERERPRYWRFARQLPTGRSARASSTASWIASRASSACWWTTAP
jgi:polyphosphate kinase 2 (PPK2 family)